MQTDAKLLLSYGWELLANNVASIWIARGLKRHKFKLFWEDQVAWIGGKRTYKPKRLITDIYSPAMGLPAAAAIE